MNIKDETKQGIILESKEKQRKSTTSSVLEVETTNNHNLINNSHLIN